MAHEPKHYHVSIETSTIIKVILFSLLLLSLFIARDIVLVLLTSIVIASFIESVVQKFAKYKIPRTVVVVVVYLICIAILFALFYLFVPIFLNEVSGLVGSLGDYVPSNSVLQNFQTSTISNTKELFTNISGNVPIGDLITSARSLINNVSGGFVQTAGILFGGIFNVILIGIMTFYLSIQEDNIEYILRVVLPIKHEQYVIDLWKRTQRKIGLWLQGQLLLGVLIGVLTYLGLTILGVKYSLVIALIAGILEIIPFGIILAGLIAMGFAYADGGAGLAFKVFLLYTILHQFETYLIAPLIVKKVIGISPLVVILAILIGAQLAGFWGVILGIPVAVLLLEYFSDVEKGKVALFDTPHA